VLLLKLYIIFLRIGVGGFGGGAGCFGLISHELVTVHGYLTQVQAGDLIATATMLPGPVAVNAAALSGFAIAGLPGAVAAVLGMLTPLIILAAVAVRLLLGPGSGKGLVNRIHHGLRPGIVALVAYSVYVLAKGRISMPPPMAHMGLDGTMLPYAADIIARNGVRLIIAAAALCVFLWKGEKLNPALAILAFGAIGLLIF